MLIWSALSTRQFPVVPPLPSFPTLCIRLHTPLDSMFLLSSEQKQLISKTYLEWTFCNSSYKNSHAICQSENVEDCSDSRIAKTWLCMRSQNMRSHCFCWMRNREGGSWVGEIRNLPNQIFLAVTFDFRYSAINTRIELAASEWNAQPFQHIVESFFMVLNVWWQFSSKDGLQKEGEVTAKEKFPFSHFWNRDSCPIWYSGIYTLKNVTELQTTWGFFFFLPLLRMPVVIWV